MKIIPKSEQKEEKWEILPLFKAPVVPIMERIVLQESSQKRNEKEGTS